MQSAAAARPPSRLRLMVRATRPRYLPTSLIPATAGLLVAIGDPRATWWVAPLAILAMLLVHAGTNVVNDVEDYARGVDGPEKMDNSRVFNTGLMSVRDGRILGIGLLLAGALTGVLICFVTGPALLLIGVLGVLAGYLYTGGPRPYKYLGVGDLATIPFLGPLTTQGAFTAVTGDIFSASAFWLGLGPGFMICAVASANNLSDVEGDRAAGVVTMAIRLGFRRARIFVIACVVLAYASLPGLWLGGLFDAWILLPLLTLPIGVRLVRQALGATRTPHPALVTLAPQLAQLHVLFCLLLVLGVVLDRV
jgi:1,4-dihydroxy-2-naphthoate octaprenyltransferase